MRDKYKMGLAMEKKLLTEYVRKKITVNDLLNKLYHLVKQMEEYQQQGKYVVVDCGHIWIDVQEQIVLEETEVPYNMVNHSMDNLLKDIVCSAVFQEDEKLESLVAFLQYLDGCKYFNLVETRRYLERVVNVFCEHVVEPKVVTEEPEQGETGVLGQAELNAMYLNKMADVAQADYQTKPVVDVMEYDNAGETGVLDESYWENLRQQPVIPVEEKKSVCRLIHVKSNKQIPIEKEIFTVGKEGESVDYVLDNPAVSRRHFDIISKGDHYFIMDNNSTNKTYVDGKEIPPKEAVEIKYGAKIKAANEEFFFEVLR